MILCKKSLYRLELQLLKFIPIVVSIMYITYRSIILFGDKDLGYLEEMAMLSVIPWIFMYVSSFAFGFCILHRIPLYGILVYDMIDLLNWLPFTDFSDNYLPIAHGINCVVFVVWYLLQYRHHKKSHHTNFKVIRIIESCQLRSRT